jgi:hypothetical protein
MPVFVRSAVSADGDSAGDRFRVSGGLDSDERSGDEAITRPGDGPQTVQAVRVC